MRSLLRTLWRIITAPFRLIFSPFVQLFRWFGQGLGGIRKFLTEEPEDTPVGDSLASAMQDPMGVLQHLNALRFHLTRAVIVLGLATALSFTFIEPLLR